MYKLADGSLSTDYKIGDEFEVVNGDDSFVNMGSIVEFLSNDDTIAPFFKLISGSAESEHDEYCWLWSALKPHRKQFTKADLKDGMVVTYKGGDDRFVFNGSLYELTGEYAYHAINLSLFSESMSTKEGLDIVKVSYMNGTLWERKEETSEQKEIKRLYGVIDESQKTIDDAKKAIAALEGK